MATLGKWSGGSVAILPTTSWSAPANLFPTEDRNDSSTYTFTASTSTLTLPSSGLADGYLLIGAFEFEDTSNGRHNPQGQFVQASGTGDFVSGLTGGYNRDTSEDRAYVRTWAFVNNPSASSTFQFQWKRDADTPTGGTVRSEFQVIPLYYSNHGLYTSTSSSLYGGTTPNQVTGFTAVSQSDTAAIEIASNVVTLKTDNKRYLVLGSQFFEGRGGRTQRWHGLRIDGTKDDASKAYTYYRNTSNDESGDMFTTLIDRATTDITVDQFCYRGDGVASGQGGANIDGSTPSVGNHALVILELNDDAKVFKTTGSSNQNIATTGPVDVTISQVSDIDFNDSDTFTRASDTGINVTPATDVLLGANISVASQNVGTGQRFTAFAEFTKNGTEDTDSFAGDYLRNNQGTQDTFGWSANLLGFQSTAANDDLGVSATELVGSEGGGGAAHIQSGWAGFWGIDLDTLEAPSGGTDALTASDIESSSEVSSPSLGQVHALTATDVQAQAELPSAGGSGTITTSHSVLEVANTGSEETISISLPSSVEDDVIFAFVLHTTTFTSTNTFAAAGWETIEFEAGIPGTIPPYAIVWKAMGATPDTSVDLDIGNSSYDNTTLIAFCVVSGADTTTFLDTAYIGPTDNGTGVADSASITTVTDGAYVLSYGQEVASSWALGSAPSGYDTPAGGLAEQSTFIDFGIFIAGKIVPTAGAENPGAWNNTTTSIFGAGSYTFAFRPESTSGDAPVLTEIVGGSTDNLTADDIESASEVSSPTIGQTHALTTTDIESSSETSSPSLGQTHNLSATDVESNSEVSSPNLGQAQTLLATDIESTSEVSQPSLSQVQALNANDIESTSEISSPTITQVHFLNASDIESSSEVSTPTFSEINALSAIDVESTSEISSPSLSESHILTSVDISSISEVSQPTLAQIYNFIAVDVESNSDVSTPSLGQSHNLVATDIESSSEVSNPTLGETSSTVLTANDIESVSEVSQPSLGQVHDLSATDIESSSNVSQPILGFSYSFTANDIQSISEVSSPALGTVNNLSATDVESTTEVSSPSLGQIYNFVAVNITSNSEVSLPNLFQAQSLGASDIEALTEVSSPNLIILPYTIVNPIKGEIRDYVFTDTGDLDYETGDGQKKDLRGYSTGTSTLNNTISGNIQKKTLRG